MLLHRERGVWVTFVILCQSFSLTDPLLTILQITGDFSMFIRSFGNVDGDGLIDLDRLQIGPANAIVKDESKSANLSRFLGVAMVNGISSYCSSFDSSKFDPNGLE